MTRRVRIGVPALLSVAVTVLGVASVDAQFLPGAANPYTGPAAGGAPVGGAGSPYTPPVATPNPQLNPYFGPSGSLANTPAPAVNPYPPYGAYGYPPFIDLSGGGYLRGAADVIDSQGRYLLTRQEAYTERERARQARIETNAMLFDEIMRRREAIPTPAEIRDRQQKQLLEASLNNPPVRQVTNATALNSILDALRTMPPKPGAQPVPVGQDVMEKINLTKGKYSGNLGLLRDQGKLDFPRGLRALEPTDVSAKLLDSVQAKTKEGYDQAVNTGRVNPELLTQLEGDARALDDLLSANTRGKLTFTEYNGAREFLKNLDAAVRLLGDSDAAEFLQGRYVPRSNDVGKLVDHMSQNGLTFAPAVNDGEKAAYLALHQALVRYYNEALR